MASGRGQLESVADSLQAEATILGSGAPVTAPQAASAVQSMTAAIAKMRQADIYIAQLEAKLAATNAGVIYPNVGGKPAGGQAGGQIPPAVSATAPAPATPTDQSQVYVSAPAAGAIALVGLLVGMGGGYMARGYFDKKKHGAKELTAGEEETPRITYKVVDKRENLRHPIIYAPPGGFKSKAAAIKYAKGLDIPYEIESYEE